MTAFNTKCCHLTKNKILKSSLTIKIFRPKLTGASTSKINQRIAPNPLNHFATSEKPSAAPVKNPNDDITNIHSTKDLPKCSSDPIMERLSDLDTTKIFPHLDFNVRLLT